MYRRLCFRTTAGRLVLPNRQGIHRHDAYASGSNTQLAPFFDNHCGHDCHSNGGSQKQREHWIRPLTAPCLIIAAALASERYYHNSIALPATQMECNSDDKNPNNDQENNKESFDIHESLKKNKGQSSFDKMLPFQNPKDLWKKVRMPRGGVTNNHTVERESNEMGSGDKLNGNKVESDDPISAVFEFFLKGAGVNNEQQDSKSKVNAPRSDFETTSKNFLKLVTGNHNAEKSKQSIAEIVASVRERSEQGDVEENASMIEIYDMLNEHKDELRNVATKYVGEIDFTRLTPTALFYYLEHEDEVKSPSWKRRMHRFCRGIDGTKMDELNDALSLAKLSYADSVDQIREGLDKHSTPYDIVYCNVRSEPGKPAHFLAVQRVQPEGSYFDNSDKLHVILVTRGTKTVADAITDLLCDTEDYQGGKAHSHILGSGSFIANKHRQMLLELCESSGKSSVDLLIIGHSLGAGAASIAGMEFNARKDSKIKARVIGFGCPAILSKDLAEKSDFITTVLNDADVVPRLSGIAAANLLMNVLEFDWVPYAKRDIQSALADLQKRQPILFNADVVTKITAVVEPLLESFARDSITSGTKERLEVELVPPGKCVHLYRDGVGFSGCYVPNTFCSEIDVSRRMIDGKCPEHDSRQHRVFLVLLLCATVAYLVLSVFADHLLHSGYQQTLLEIERQRTGDLHFRFEEAREE